MVAGIIETAVAGTCGYFVGILDPRVGYKSELQQSRNDKLPGFPGRSPV